MCTGRAHFSFVLCAQTEYIYGVNKPHVSFVILVLYYIHNLYLGNSIVLGITRGQWTREAQTSRYYYGRSTDCDDDEYNNSTIKTYTLRNLGVFF